MMKQILLIVELADWKEDCETGDLSEEGLRRLSRMLETEGGETKVGEKTIEFGNEGMEKLLENISPLKRELVDYISQLRELISL